MDKKMLTPKEVADATIQVAEGKTRLNFMQSLLLSIFAGVFIGFGSHGFLTVTQTLGNIDVGLSKFMGASVFPVGLMLVLMAGAELFTGNNLMIMALLDKKISLASLSKNWIIVYTGNFIGSILLAYAIYKSGLYDGESISKLVISVSEAKVSISFYEASIRGILCNMIVTLSVWFATAAKDVIGKIFAIWFPIMLFVLSGFEHSIANMFFLPLGKLLGLDTSWLDIWVKNLIPVTIGNVIGGGIIISGVYYLTYILPHKTIKR